MVASMVPAKRTGVYMGILNMMIVVPMLVETVTFGWIFKHLLDSKGTNAITLAGVLHGHRRRGDAVGEPAAGGRGSPIMPLGRKRSITVYDRVVVGPDGAPISLYAVDRAAEVAQAAQASSSSSRRTTRSPRRRAPTGRRAGAPRAVRRPRPPCAPR